MTETQLRIKEYKEKLPRLKERVAAVAILLAMSFAMVTTVSFAWLTLSRSPEVSGVTTNVAANGNLEIALVKPNGDKPDESKVGDGSSSKSIVEKNLTWGNLLNLSDPSYGLDNIVMRPATLNTTSIQSNPLSGAEYGTDGRVEHIGGEYGFAKWQLATDKTPAYFKIVDAEDMYGVRAISTVKTEVVGAAQKYYDMIVDAQKANNLAASTYMEIASSDNPSMQSLATMMGIYMTARMNPSHETLNNPDCKTSDIDNLAKMYVAFLNAFEKEAEAMAALINLQRYCTIGDSYTPISGSAVFNLKANSGKDYTEIVGEGENKKTIKIINITEFINDYNTIKNDLVTLQAIVDSKVDSVKWKDEFDHPTTSTGKATLNDIVNHLVNVGACTIGDDNTPISSIGASNALAYLSGTQEARITNGILYRFEERTGGYIEVKNMSINATINRNIIGTQSATVKANIKTTAPRDYTLFNNNLTYAKSLYTGTITGDGEAVANDTYGFAIDFWVRTNAVNSFLTLGGNILTDGGKEVDSKINVNGVEYQVYTMSSSYVDDDGKEVTVSSEYYCEERDVVLKENEAPVKATVWYSAISHTPQYYQYDNKWYVHNGDSYPSLIEDSNKPNPNKKVEIVETVIGYEGDNRIWQDGAFLSVDSTTQGSGSCYTFYATKPEDQERSLQLLQAMKIAFVGEDGQLFTTAEMDIEHKFVQDGKVIVPIKLPADKSFTDETGKPVNYITALKSNEATRITAIVYLDGKYLTNKDVLDASSIQGKLNIQFQSTQKLKPLSDEDLAAKTIKVSATIDNNSFDYATQSNSMVSKVTVNIDAKGETLDLNSIQAFFVRSINEYSGTRQKNFTLTPTGNPNEFSASYKFTAPGKYILRTVVISGIEYELETPITVNIKGFAVDSITWGYSASETRVLTDSSMETTNLTVSFAGDEDAKHPTTVQAIFIREEDGMAVTSNLKAVGSGVFEGDVRFLSSGRYVLTFLKIDGSEENVEEGHKKILNLYLGMNVTVYTSSDQNFIYEPNKWTDEEAARREKIKFSVTICDEKGNEMKGLNDVRLFYSKAGSGAKMWDIGLTWNGTYYVGEVESEAGTYRFMKVTAEGDDVDRAISYPTFNIRSAEPPKYYASATTPVIYHINKSTGAKMTVEMLNTDGFEGNLWAYIVKKGQRSGDRDEELWIPGMQTADAGFTDDEKAINVWEFDVPGEGKEEEGYWVLTAIKIIGAYDEAGNEYTEANPWIYETNIETKIVVEPTVTFANKDETFTGSFMQEHTISGIQVTLKDFEGQKLPIRGGSIKIDYIYQNDSATLGGYTPTDAANANFSVQLTSSDGITFTQSGTQAIRLAGTYNPEVEIYLDDNTRVYASAPIYTVKSTKPTVVISSISPTGTFDVDTTGVGSGHQSATVPAYTSTNATVYFKCSRSGSGSTCDPYRHNYSRPSVTLTLAGIGSATNAEVSFGSGVHIYNGTTQTTGYAWTANGACARNIGYYRSRTAANDDKTAAGTLTANTLILTYNGNTYTVTIPTITINNPY